MMKNFIKQRLRAAGYEIVGRSAFMAPEGLRSALLEAYGISLVIDIGANVGQFASTLRGLGYKGRMVSFEPLSSAFAILEEKCSSDAKWSAYNYAIGDFDGTSTINIAGNSQSSSLLSMKALHEAAAPESRYLGTEEITVRRLDGLFSKLYASGESVFLKIDTQGFEKRVLSGAQSILPLIDTIQLEMSFFPLYDDEMLFPEMYGHLKSNGYELVSIIPGFSEQGSGRLLQADGLFRRRK